MKKIIAMILAALLALSLLTAALAATYTDKDTVKKVQQALNDAGYNCGTPDGVAGKKTTAAITQYQTDKGLEVTATIDDALLEAMGITMQQSEGSESGEKQGNTDVISEESDQDIDLSDPRMLANYYNVSFVNWLSMLGIDIENDKIGFDAYLIKNLNIENFPGASSDLDSEKTTIKKHDDWVEFFCNLEEADELTFLEHAALYAFLDTMANYYECSEEEWVELSAQLGKVPDRDDKISIADIDVNFESPSIEISGYKNDTQYVLHAQKGKTRIEGDDIPDIPAQIVELTGGIPDSFDSLADRYDIAEMESVLAQWDGAAMFTDLIETGTHTFSAMGHEWVNALLGQYLLDISVADDQVTVTRKETESSPTWVGLYSKEGWYLTGSKPDEAEDDGQGLDFHKDASIEVDYKTDEYPQINYRILRRSEGRYYIQCSAKRSDGIWMTWLAEYNKNGSLEKKEYTEE